MATHVAMLVTAKLLKTSRVLVAHACSPSYLGSWDQEDRGSRPEPEMFSSHNLYLQNNQSKMAWKCGSSCRVPALQVWSSEFKRQSQHPLKQTWKWTTYSYRKEWLNKPWYSHAGATQLEKGMARISMHWPSWFQGKYIYTLSTKEYLLGIVFYIGNKEKYTWTSSFWKNKTRGLNQELIYWLPVRNGWEEVGEGHSEYSSNVTVTQKVKLTW
jgi:hypothetical protein